MPAWVLFPIPKYNLHMARKTAKANLKAKSSTAPKQTPQSVVQTTTTTTTANTKSTKSGIREKMAHVFNTESLLLQAGSDFMLKMALSFQGYPELQSAFIAKLEHEPKVVALFADLMGEHYENLKERKWQFSGYNKIIDIDSSTFVLLYLIQYLRGHQAIKDWLDVLDDPKQRPPLQVVFPQFLPLYENCFEYSLLIPWLVFNKWRTTEDYAGSSTLKDTQQALGRLFADLQLFQPWARGNSMVYKGGRYPLKSAVQQYEFTKPRLSVFLLNLQELDAARKELLALDIIDLNYQHNMLLEFNSYCNLYDAAKRVLLALKRAGVDLSHTLIMTKDDGGKYAAKFTKAVTDLGAHYLMLSNIKLGFSGQLLPETWRDEFQYVRCKSILQIGLDPELGRWRLVEPKALADLPSEVQGQPHVWVSTLDLNADENRQQLICAYELMSLYMDAVKVVANAGLMQDPTVDKVTQLEPKIAKSVGLDQMKKAFNQFVWKQLLKEGKVKDEEVNAEKLKVMFTDLAVFLHYFALFSKPALKYMREYSQSDPKGLPVALRGGNDKE